MEIKEDKEIMIKLNDIKKNNFKAYSHIKNIINLMYFEIKNEKNRRF